VAALEPSRGAHAEAGGDSLDRTLDRKDRERLSEAVARAEALLGRERGDGEPDLDAIPSLIAALEARLTGGEDPGREAHEAQLGRLRSRFRRRQAAFNRVEEAIESMREMTSPPAILDDAPRRLCECSELERVLLSEVDDGLMIARSAHFQAAPERAREVLATLAEQPLRLEHPLLEAEVLRRRRATAVSEARLNPRVDPRLNEAMGWRSYVVAPVVAHGQVIAVVHGDRGSDQPDVLDREVLWRFAVGTAQAYESAALRRGLRREREQMGRFLDRLDGRLGELSDAGIQLIPSRAPNPPERPSRSRPVGDESPFEGLLTDREREVLTLMAEGLSNRRIAGRLVISEGTVKFHVHGILEKLRAANRAEAVSRYMQRTRS
jgi:LuxR family transcriptional regulator, regulator of acetate metabolism